MKRQKGAKRILIAAALAASSGFPAAAQDWTYVSSFGDEYTVTLNENGAKLQSLYPKAWFIEAGADSRIERGIDVLFLGKSCDAYHEVFGEGRWWWANGGFGADFENFSIRFPRQEIDITGGLDCRL